MGQAPLRGRLMWVELMTKDLPAAEKFYTTVVGWTITPFAGAACRTRCSPGPAGRMWAGR